MIDFIKNNINRGITTPYWEFTIIGIYNGDMILLGTNIYSFAERLVKKKIVLVNSNFKYYHSLHINDARIMLKEEES